MQRIVRVNGSIVQHNVNLSQVNSNLDLNVPVEVVSDDTVQVALDDTVEVVLNEELNLIQNDVDQDAFVDDVDEANSEEAVEQVIRIVLLDYQITTNTNDLSMDKLLIVFETIRCLRKIEHEIMPKTLHKLKEGLTSKSHRMRFVCSNCDYLIKLV